MVRGGATVVRTRRLLERILRRLRRRPATPDYLMTTDQAADYTAMDPGGVAAIVRRAAKASFESLVRDGRATCTLSDDEVSRLLSHFASARMLKPHAEALDRSADRLGLFAESFKDLSAFEQLALSPLAPPAPGKFRIFPWPPGLKAQAQWRGAAPVRGHLIGWAAASIALSDARLAAKSAELIVADACKHVIVANPSSLISVRLHPLFHWCLICLGIARDDPQQSTGREWLSSILIELAVLKISDARWAGFWEQYYLRRALERCDRERAAKLVALLDELPLIKDWSAVASAGDLGAVASAEGTETRGAGHPKAAWIEHAPEFAGRLVARRL